MNRSNTPGLLTTAGAETVYDTTVIISFEIDGKIYNKAAVTDGATPPLDGNTGEAHVAVKPDKICVFVWGMNASGTVSLYQGDINDVDGDTDIAEQNPAWPSIPADIAPFAYTIYQTTGASAAAGLTPGTGNDNCNATGLTATTVDISTIPGRPQSD